MRATVIITRVYETAREKVAGSLVVELWQNHIKTAYQHLDRFATLTGTLVCRTIAKSLPRTVYQLCAGCDVGVTEHQLDCRNKEEAMASSSKRKYPVSQHTKVLPQISLVH